MSIYVFLGPTLPLEEAKKVLHAIYLPPVAGGDVQRLMAQSPKAIGIIDGVFDQTAAVFHKEILYALSRGVHVFGASSMGALRAAELHPFGMVGVGKIFELFRSGELEDDDEVAVNHGTSELTYQTMSEAMVNLRDGLQRARDAGAISQSSHDLLVQSAKAMFYVNRSWRHLFHIGPRLGLPSSELLALQEFVTREKPNLKRDDALSLLRRMASEPAQETPAVATAFSFEESKYWNFLRKEAVATGHYVHHVKKDHQQDPPLEAFDLHARLFAKNPEDLLRSSLFYAMIEWLASWYGLLVDEEELNQQIGQLDLKDGDVPEDAIHSLARLEVLMQKLLYVSLPFPVDGYLPLALLRTNQLSSTIVQVRRQWHWLRARGLEQPSLETAGLNEDQLIAWYQARSRLGAPSLDDYSDALYVNRHDFLTEALRVYLFERAEKKNTT